MTRRRIRRVAAAVALAMALTFAAPAHAAGWRTWKGGAGWLEAVVQWVARLWTGEGVGGVSKAGHGIDPNVDPSSVTPPPSPDAGFGIDPNG
jgi:hypothetical protein